MLKQETFSRYQSWFIYYCYCTVCCCFYHCCVLWSNHLQCFPIQLPYHNQPNTSYDIDRKNLVRFHSIKSKLGRMLIRITHTIYHTNIPPDCTGLSIDQSLKRVFVLYRAIFSCYIMYVCNGNTDQTYITTITSAGMGSYI